MKNFLGAASVALFLAANSAAATAIVLDFEGVNASYPSGFAFVQDFYNGGQSSDATSGTNFGVGFSSNAQAICLNTDGVACSNTSRGGQGNPNSQRGGLFFLDGSETFMNVAAGFETGFSFFYAAINNTGSINVFDDLNGTGNLLASLDLGLTPSTCGPEFAAGFCPFVAQGVAFNGVAKSVSFGGVANQVAFDDVTFGSVIPDPEPEVAPIPLPAGLPLALAAFGALAFLRRRA